MIEDITQKLFAEPPADTLYHYTSLAGMLGIVDSGVLRASDIRYMNDSTELRHTLELLRQHISQRISAGTDYPGLLNQLQEWLSNRIVGGPLVFGASFRANGNLLSQWRGYSVHGKGVSLGFNPQHIMACARAQHFQVGKCLYDSAEQSRLIEQLVDAVEGVAAGMGERSGAVQGPEGESWYDVFEHIEEDLLRIAAILKHPSFEEEQEWRIVSPVFSGCQGRPIHFREGASMLVPYYTFELKTAVDGDLVLDHVFVGPTSNAVLSLNSVELYLAKQNASPRQGIDYCQIPYRQR